MVRYYVCVMGGDGRLDNEYRYPRELVEALGLAARMRAAGHRVWLFALAL